MAIGLSSAPYVCSVILAMEFGILIAYFKITRKSISFWEDVMPSCFSLSSLPQSALPDGSRKKLWLFGLPRLPLVQFVCFGLVYLPFFVFTRNAEQLERFKSIHKLTAQIIGSSLHVVAGLLLVGLMVIYHTYFNRWLKLKELPQQSGCLSIVKSDNKVTKCPSIKVEIDLLLKDEAISE